MHWCDSRLSPQAQTSTSNADAVEEKLTDLNDPITTLLFFLATVTALTFSFHFVSFLHRCSRGGELSTQRERDER